MKKYFVILLIFTLLLTSCSVTDRTMQTPNYHIEYYKADFEYSEQVVAEATVTRILCIDWSRILGWKTASISNSTDAPSAGIPVALSASIPVEPIVGMVSTVIPVFGHKAKGKVRSYALHNLMAENPGYDVVIYPQNETKMFIFPLFYSKRTAKVTARLAKIK
ncbi:MAG: hypothetical protein PHD00_05680 [Bacteroidales bacterium]|nr:hypothetical protein [Bacteroidales bacterium]